ncbi:MAG: hypothetical protein ACK445_03445 [Bacteroidota bacterium]
MLTILLSGCIVTQIGYFEVNPYATIKSNKIDQPLHVRISSRIMNEQKHNFNGLTIEVTDLHRSLYYATQKVYADLFSEVKPEQKNDIGFFVELQQMEAKWEVQEVRKKVVDTYETFNEAKCTIFYAGNMYRNDLLISRAAGQVTVTQSELNTHRIDEVYKESIKQALSAIAQQHFNQ